MGIVLKWMFVHQWGVAGIAGATSLYYSLNLLLMTRALNRAVASRAHE